MRPEVGTYDGARGVEPSRASGRRLTAPVLASGATHHSYPIKSMCHTPQRRWLRVDSRERDFALNPVVQHDALDLDPGAYLQLLVAPERRVYRALEHAWRLSISTPPGAN